MLPPQSLTVHPQRNDIAVIGCNWVALLHVGSAAHPLTTLPVSALSALPPVPLPHLGSEQWTCVPFDQTSAHAVQQTRTQLSAAALSPIGLIRNACFVSEFVHDM